MIGVVEVVGGATVSLSPVAFGQLCSVLGQLVAVARHRDAVALEVAEAIDGLVAGDAGPAVSLLSRASLALPDGHWLCESVLDAYGALVG